METNNPEAITLPYNFNPRSYQLPFLRAMDNGYKRAVLVWHRRSGKDLTVVNFTIKRMYERVGAYYYLFPTYRQAKKVIWNGMTRDGKKFTSYFPEPLIKRIDNSDMFIEMDNGSTFQLVGSDEIDSIMGVNPVGCIFSEWSLQNPTAWDYIRPILAENGGWAAFIYTPRGRNHGYTLLETARAFPDIWYSEVLTADKTQAIPADILSQERLEIIKKDGNDALYQQEYMCNFDVPIQGAYYADQLMMADKEGRISGVPYDPNTEVHTAWDLGMDDSMTIWFFQLAGREFHFIDYYESNGEGINYYIKYLKDKQYIYGKHYAPHDIKVRELSTGKSRFETADSLGIKFEVVPKLSIWDGIQAVRNMLPKCWFDKIKCERGLSSLRSYHKEWDEDNQVFKNKPEHDWCVAGNTKVRTTHGWIPIKEIKVGDCIYGFSQKEKRIVPAKVTKSGKTRVNTEVVEIGLNNGKSIVCTSDHKFMLRDSTYKEAKDLIEDDSLMPFYESKNRKYIEIDLNDGTFADEHKYIYSRFNGCVEENYHIDHIDGNHYNNDPSNLEKLEKDEHCSKTFRGQNNTERKEIDKTNYGREFYSRDSRFVKCKFCKKERWLNYKKSYCSNKCRNSFRSIRDNSGLVPSRSKESKLEKNRKQREKYWLEKNHRVRFIKWLEKKVDTYDIEVAGLNNFVAEGVVIHNSSHGSDGFRSFAVGFQQLVQQQSAVNVPVHFDPYS